MNPLMGPAVQAGQMTAQAAPAMNQQAIQSIRRMVGMYRAAKNPRAAMQSLMQQNPGIGKIMQMAGPGGLKGMFYQLCRENEVEPDSVLQQIL